MQALTQYSLVYVTVVWSIYDGMHCLSKMCDTAALTTETIHDIAVAGTTTSIHSLTGAYNIHGGGYESMP